MFEVDSMANGNSEDTVDENGDIVTPKEEPGDALAVQMLLESEDYGPITTADPQVLRAQLEQQRLFTRNAEDMAFHHLQALRRAENHLREAVQVGATLGDECAKEKQRAERLETMLASAKAEIDEGLEELRKERNAKRKAEDALATLRRA